MDDREKTEDGYVLREVIADFDVAGAIERHQARRVENQAIQDAMGEIDTPREAMEGPHKEQLRVICESIGYGRVFDIVEAWLCEKLGRMQRDHDRFRAALQKIDKIGDSCDHHHESCGCADDAGFVAYVALTACKQCGGEDFDDLRCVKCDAPAHTCSECNGERFVNGICQACGASLPKGD